MEKNKKVSYGVWFATNFFFLFFFGSIFHKSIGDEKKGLQFLIAYARTKKRRLQKKNFNFPKLIVFF